MTVRKMFFLSINLVGTKGIIEGTTVKQRGRLVQGENWACRRCGTQMQVNQSRMRENLGYQVEFRWGGKQKNLRKIRCSLASLKERDSKYGDTRHG